MSSHWGLGTKTVIAHNLNTAKWPKMFEINWICSIYRRGIRRKCLLSSCSFFSLVFSSAVNMPALASAGTNLMLSFSEKIKKKRNSQSYSGQIMSQNESINLSFYRIKLQPGLTFTMVKQMQYKKNKSSY